MKKTLFFIFFISCFIISFGTSQQSDEKKSTDFRKANWGMKKEEVKKLEAVTLIKEADDYLIFEDTLLDFEFNIYYSFLFDKLVKGSYVLKEDIIKSPEDYIEFYLELKKILKKKYGKEKQHINAWFDETYKDKQQEWGKALELGHFMFVSEFETDKTKISLGLWKKGPIALLIYYESIELYELLKKQKKEIEKKKASDDL